MTCWVKQKTDHQIDLGYRGACVYITAMGLHALGSTWCSSKMHHNNSKRWRCIPFRWMCIHGSMSMRRAARHTRVLLPRQPRQF